MSELLSMARRRRARLVAAAGAICVASVATAPVSAQEAEDVEDIRAQIRVLQDRLQEMEDLRDQVEVLERRLEEAETKTEAVGRAAAADVPPQVSSGNDRIKLSVSGHINRGVLVTDDGDSTDVFHVDNSFSASRVRFQGEGRLNEDISAGTNLEVQLRTNRSSSVNQVDDEPVGDTGFDRRKVEFYFDSRRLGRLWVGHGSTASDGTTEVDFSGTSVIAGRAVTDFAGGMFFFDDATGALSDTQVGDVFDDLDGLGRRDRVRYDTPSLGGLVLSASSVRNGAVDGAIRYGTEIAGARFGAAVGYAESTREDDAEILGGSTSLLLANGFNVTLAGGKRFEQTDDRDDPYYGFVKLGYQFQPFAIGATAVSLDWYEGRDFGVNGSESRSQGFGLVQNVDDLGTELYLGARRYTVDLDAGEDFEPVHAAMSGARIKF